MSGIELLTLASSIASLILSILAIWLTLSFYKMSTKASEKTTEASKAISATVERLEKLFDKLYADTFSMMRETVSDMRRHIWPDDSQTELRINDEVEKKTGEKVDELRILMSSELSQLLARQALTDERLEAISGEMESLLDRAIESSSKVESQVREETIRESILHAIRGMSRKRRTVYADSIVVLLEADFSLGQVVEELRKMENEGIIVFDEDELGPMTQIELSV